MEIGWIRQVRGLAETLGKHHGKNVQQEKRVNILNIASALGSFRKKSRVPTGQNEHQNTWVSWGLLYLMSHNHVPLTRSRLSVT